MRVVEESILIRAPQQPLFDLAPDYRLRLKWDPFLRGLTAPGSEQREKKLDSRAVPEVPFGYLRPASQWGFCKNGRGAIAAWP